MSDYEIVYSDDPNFKKRCPKCGKHPCACPKLSDMVPGAHTLKIRLEKNARGGKNVTVVFELPDNESYFNDLQKKLKGLCGTGGTFKNNRIEIQGDHREKIKAYLEKVGFKVKLAGG
ncbi:MAG: translation initiation factor [Bacteriovoracia bacterium]